MTYRLLARGVLHIESGDTILPTSQAWQEYKAWLAAGHTPLPYVPPTPPAPTQAQLDAEAELQARATIKSELLADPAVVALMKWTPDQANTWIDANVTDLASAKAALKILARVLALLARRAL